MGFVFGKVIYVSYFACDYDRVGGGDSFSRCFRERTVEIKWEREKVGRGGCARVVFRRVGR